VIVPDIAFDTCGLGIWYGCAVVGGLKLQEWTRTEYRVHMGPPKL